MAILHAMALDEPPPRWPRASCAHASAASGREVSPSITSLSVPSPPVTAIPSKSSGASCAHRVASPGADVSRTSSTAPAASSTGRALLANSDAPVMPPDLGLITHMRRRGGNTLRTAAFTRAASDAATSALSTLMVSRVSLRGRGSEERNGFAAFFGGLPTLVQSTRTTVALAASAQSTSAIGHDAMRSAVMAQADSPWPTSSGSCGCASELRVPMPADSAGGRRGALIMHAHSRWWSCRRE
eukprot:7389920-Prymnesium_polylepis.2